MALAIDGVPVSGSRGNVTFSRNRYGAYTRRRTKPVNPNSARQNKQRSIFRTVVEMWGSTLTATQRSQWNNWATLTPWTNKAGESVRLTGQAAWVRHAAAWLTSGVSGPTLSGVWLTPPPQNDVGAINIDYSPGATLEFDPVTQTFESFSFGAQALNNSSGLMNGVFLIEVTPGQNVGVTFPGSRWSSFGALAGVGDWAANAVTPVSFVPGTSWSYSLGQEIYFRLRGVGTSLSGTERRVTTQQIVGPYTLVAVTP